jgi:hypothetical protein
MDISFLLIVVSMALVFVSGVKWLSPIARLIAALAAGAGIVWAAVIYFR